jgi:3-phenylpropionate/trans-cinnamate dioxygenase ferredoxin reductase component
MRPLGPDVLIAGGGLAAQRCCETLRRLGFDGRIAMICEERCAPYDRPPLSKAFITSDRKLPQLAIKPRAWYVENEVELLLGLTAHELDVAARRVVVGESSKELLVSYEAHGQATAAKRHAHSSLGRTLRYGRLVIATGSRPRRLSGIPLRPKVHELRTHADALSLRAALRDGPRRLAILGAGLIGLEVASSARALGLDVTVIEAAATPLGRALPPKLGHWLARLHREQGVDVRLETCVRAIGQRGARATLELSDSSTLRADTVLVAAGTVPATEWLASSGLGPGPIHTDAGGHTRIPNIYAAGDAACYPDPYSGERSPTPHWEAAVRQGVAVAHSIVGVRPRAPTPAMFWSDQYDRRIQFVGHAPAECEIELDYDDSQRPETTQTEMGLVESAGTPFAAWIRHNGHPAAAMLVNRPDALGRARRWIADASIKETRRAA